MIDSVVGPASRRRPSTSLGASPSTSLGTGSALLPALLVALIACACAGVRPTPPPATAPASDRSGSGGINRPEHRDKPHVVLISFDGFRADYLDQFDLPNFRRVMQRGARASALVPVFPSLTFPNHYSLVTGLYAERHGIVANTFYDPAREQTYTLSDRAAVSDGTWYRGEPIWVTAETQGMVAACFFWPGSEAAIKGVRPTFWKEYDPKVANDTRVHTVLEWLRLPVEQRPHFVTLYFSELDTVSHQSTVDSPEVRHALQSLDRTLGVLLDGLETLPIRDRIYLLLTSDHGMVDTSLAQTITIESLIDTAGVRIAEDGPVTNLHVSEHADSRRSIRIKEEPATARAIRDQLNAKLQHGRAYLRTDLPARYRYQEDPRVGDVVVVMEESWMLMPAAALARRTRTRWGMHGWDPALPSMHAIFVVSGPDIRTGITVPAVDNVDVYPFMAEVLGLRPATEIDGRAGRIGGIVSR